MKNNLHALSLYISVYFFIFTTFQFLFAGEVHNISIEAKLIFLLFNISFLLGSSLFIYFKNSFIQVNKKIRSNSIYLMIISFLLCDIYFAFHLFLNYLEDISVSRLGIYSSNIRDSSIFNLYIYTSVIYFKSFLSIFLNFIFVRSFLNNKFITTFVVLLLFILDSFIFQSRGQIYVIVFLVILSFYLSNLKDIAISIGRRYLILFALFLLLIVSAITLFRNNSLDSLILLTSNYFRIGPLLFSSLLNENFSLHIPNPSIYNASYFFSGLEYLVSIFIRGLSHADFVNTGFILNKFTDQQQPIFSFISSGGESKLFLYNSFYTILFEPFVAFGLFGVLFLGSLLGFLLNFFLVAFKNTSCDFSLLNLIYIFTLLITSIFGNALGSPILWIYVLTIPFISSMLFLYDE